MVTLDHIREAEKKIRPHIHKTPLLRCASLDEMSFARLLFKCENFQKTGSFKIRGAAHFIQRLNGARRRKGVVAHSAGNHAAAVALAAPGERTFPVIQKVVDRFLTVRDDDTLAATRLIWERMKIIVEPSAAITLAAVLNHKSQFEGKRLCLLLTGGNVDLENMGWVREA